MADGQLSRSGFQLTGNQVTVFWVQPQDFKYPDSTEISDAVAAAMGRCCSGTTHQHLDLLQLTAGGVAGEPTKPVGFRSVSFTTVRTEATDQSLVHDQ